MKFLSIVIPCFNEEVNLQKGVLFKINEFLAKKNFSWEVLIVDDGSMDDSIAQIEKFIKNHQRFSLIKNKHQGKAQAVITGVKKAVGDAILFADMDQATPIEEVDKLIPYLDKKYDVVIGSRNASRHGAPVLRLFMARGFILLRRLILGLKDISDTQCGFKLFSQKTAKDIFSRLRLYSARSTASGPMVTAGFDVEILYIAQKLGFQIKEVPVYWCYVETRRVNPLTESINGLMDMLKLKFYDIKGLYK
ncbi:glycosyltransferase [Candidatus Roizmanbacteria bacterium]|nr:glycosyltransferase [Candidatus Roizmanbacteria bacterium]